MRFVQGSPPPEYDLAGCLSIHQFMELTHYEQANPFRVAIKLLEEGSMERELPRSNLAFVLDF